jgi:hypothetical protein
MLRAANKLIMLSVIILSDIMLRVIMLNAPMLNVVMLSVVAPNNLRQRPQGLRLKFVYGSNKRSGLIS